MVYVGADGIGVSTDWNAGSCKSDGGIGTDPASTGAALEDIGWESIPVAADAAALLAVAADGSRLE